MSGEHFSGGEMPHTPIQRIDNELYADVERNIVYGCTDVALRDPSTGKIFLGSRQTEPQIGPWLVGGRSMYAKGIDENAAMQVANDTGLTLSETRFHHIGTYSTDFPVASPGHEDHGRHTLNAVMMADLTPEEIEELNRRVANDELRDEYSHGRWYELSEIADDDSDFAYLLKQMVRDIHDHDTLRAALHSDAIDENEVRDLLAQEEREAIEQRERIASLSLMFGLNTDEATAIEEFASDNAGYAVMWAHMAEQKYSGRGDELANTLRNILGNDAFGDVEISRQIRSMGLSRPDIMSDNGPALRGVLNGAVLALDYNSKHDGKVFHKIAALDALRKPAMHQNDNSHQ